MDSQVRVWRYRTQGQLRRSPPPRDCTQLDLSFCKGITDEDLKFLERFKFLQSVDLSGCEEITLMGLRGLLKALPKITKLLISDINLGATSPALSLLVPRQVHHLGISCIPDIRLPFIKELEISNFDGDSFVSIECPRLTKLQIACTGSVNHHKFLSLLLQLAGVSTQLQEFHVLLDNYQYYREEKELRMLISRVLPFAVCQVIAYRDKATMKKEEAERQHKINQTISRVTQASPHSLSYNLLNGFNEGQYSDYLIQINKDNVIRAHKIVLHYRCPRLLQDTTFLKEFPMNVVVPFFQYIYSDILPAKDQDEIMPLADLQKLRELAIHYQLPRLESIVRLLIESATLVDDTEVEAVLCEPTVSPSTLSQDLAIPFENEAFCDVKLVACDGVGNPVGIPFKRKFDEISPKNQECVHASRFILACRCEFFKKFFDSGMKDSNNNAITIHEISQKTLYLLVRYLYTDDQIFLDCVAELYMKADMMRLPQLHNQCITFVKENLNSNNVILMAKQAYIFNAEEIANYCFQYFVTHAEELFKQEEIQLLDWEILQVFLAHTYNYLLDDVNDERNTVSLQYNILMAALMWVKRRWVPSTGNQISEYADNPKDNGNYHYNRQDMQMLRDKLESMFQCLFSVRLSFVDFAHCLIESQLFSQEAIAGTFARVGVILDVPIPTPNKENLCPNCHSWGYEKIASYCTCYPTGIYCHWCNYTGKCSKIGSPCGECFMGELIRIKFLFDQKMVSEYIHPGPRVSKEELQGDWTDTESEQSSLSLEDAPDGVI